MVSIKLLLFTTLLVSQAGQTRFGDAPQTLRREVGQKFIASLILDPTPPLPIIKSLSLTISYPASSAAVPSLPATPQAVSSPVPATLTETSPSPGTINLTWTPKTPVALPTSSLADITFTCTSPKTFQFTLSNIVLTDVDNNLIPVSAAAPDTVSAVPRGRKLELRLR